MVIEPSQLPQFESGTVYHSTSSLLHHLMSFVHVWCHTFLLFVTHNFCGACEV